MNAERSAKIDSYLHGEMTEHDVENFEQQFMADDAVFYDITERENDLVDRFVRGDLKGGDADRFQNSLSRFPHRRIKIANALLLNDYIAEQKQFVLAAEAQFPWYKRLGFAFRTPALVSSALALLLVGTIGFLVIQNRNLNRQVAGLNTNGQSLNELRQREAELQASLEAERAAGSDLTTDLESERERRTALENELAELRKQIASKPPSNDSPIVPTIATLILRPVSGRGGANPVRTLRLDNDEKRVALKIFLPSDVDPNDSYTVRVNDIPAADAIKPNKETGGANSVSASVSTGSFRDGLNRVEVFNSKSQNILSFAVILERGNVR
jgi:hypothetical protein